MTLKCPIYPLSKSFVIFKHVNFVHETKKSCVQLCDLVFFSTSSSSLTGQQSNFISSVYFCQIATNKLPLLRILNCVEFNLFVELDNSEEMSWPTNSDRRPPRTDSLYNFRSSIVPWLKVILTERITVTCHQIYYRWPLLVNLQLIFDSSLPF